MRASTVIKLALVLLICFEQGYTTPLQKESGLTHQISDLSSSDMQTRITAFMRMKDDPEILKLPEVKAALVDLLDRENQVVASATATPGSGTDEKYGEGYGEYLDDLIDSVAKTADWHDPRQVCVLAHSAYNSASTVPERLAVEAGGVAVPCLMKMARGNFYDRRESIPVLVRISTVTKDLDPALRQQVKQSILTWLKDPDASIRMTVVLAIGMFCGPGMIPILDDIAHSDPESRLVDGKPVFDVREFAVTAIHSIQKRAKTQ
jgi:hypothetical protein